MYIPMDRDHLAHRVYLIARRARDTFIVINSLVFFPPKFCTRVTLAVYDLNGKKVLGQHFVMQVLNAEIDFFFLPSTSLWGFY